MGSTQVATRGWMDDIAWSAEGLVAAVVQDAKTDRVLMLAWMNREALMRTVQSGQAHYWSRSRERLWRKGEESGHTQEVKEVRIDCDGDAILLRVEQKEGIACHTGRERCFFRRYEDGSWVLTDPVLKRPEDTYPRSPAPKGSR